MSLQAAWLGLKRRTRLPGGIDLAWVAWGNPAGMPLVLIHGFTDNSRSWSLVAPFLISFRLIIPDLRGHGVSGAPLHGYGPTAFAADLMQLLDHLGIARAHVVGHSLGGMVAQAWAAYAPEQIASLTLISTGRHSLHNPNDWLWKNVNRQSFPLDPDGEFMTTWFANSLPVDVGFLAHERREAAAIPRFVWQAVIKELTLAEPGRLNPFFSGPTVILWGTADPLFPAASQEVLRASLPRAAFHAVPDAGHNVHWEFPEVVANCISANASFTVKESADGCGLAP